VPRVQRAAAMVREMRHCRGKGWSEGVAVLSRTRLSPKECHSVKTL